MAERLLKIMVKFQICQQTNCFKIHYFSESFAKISELISKVWKLYFNDYKVIGTIQTLRLSLPITGITFTNMNLIEYKPVKVCVKTTINRIGSTVISHLGKAFLLESRLLIVLIGNSCSL